MSKKILTAFVLSAFLYCSYAQNITHRYKESKEDFRNPERGFYIPYGTKASNFVLLDAGRLSAYKTQEQQTSSASYKVNVSLLYRAYELDIFKDKPLSDSFLINLQKDFDVVRTAGLKIILRFAYTNSPVPGDCKDEYGICPPYGDAPVHIVLQHIKQLRPLLQKNGDIIAVLQQGFVGIWGENYFTDYFGCPTDIGEGVINDSGWINRNLFLKALLDAMPKNRMVQVRTPQIKQRYIGGVNITPKASPVLNSKDAYSGKDIARIAFHNDCFLASADDYGTFFDYGNSHSKRDTANFVMRNYFEKESRYLAIGGETCDDAFSPQNDCAPAGYAEKEMADMHYSFLNAAYNNNVNNDWDSAGCMHSIKTKLGYRFVLVSSSLPKLAKAGSSFNLQLQLKNIGYATPYNPRPAQLVLRNTANGNITRLKINTDVRKWFSGEISLKQTIQLPAAVKAGEYEILLALPDEAVSINTRPEYSIRFANEDVWEETTGYNKLNHTITIK